MEFLLGLFIGGFAVFGYYNLDMQTIQTISTLYIIAGSFVYLVVESTKCWADYGRASKSEGIKSIVQEWLLIVSLWPFTRLTIHNNLNGFNRNYDYYL